MTSIDSLAELLRPAAQKLIFQAVKTEFGEFLSDYWGAVAAKVCLPISIK